MPLRDAIGLTADSVFLHLGGPTAALNIRNQHCRNPAHRRFLRSMQFQTVDHRNPSPDNHDAAGDPLNDHSERLQVSAK
jgi:hypothetical protein